MVITEHLRIIPVFMFIFLLIFLSCGKKEVSEEEKVTASPHGMIYIPGGTFSMGAVAQDIDARPCERPAHQVTLRGFFMDMHEVTVADYEIAVSKGIVPAPSCRSKNSREEFLCNWGKPDRGQHPVNGVSWNAAGQYCRWLGKRLPTEAEYEYVLRERKNDFKYPWGNRTMPPQGYGNYVDDSTMKLFPEWERLKSYSDGFTGTSPVCSFSPNSLGLYDISGNIWEWCSDAFNFRDYSFKHIENPTGSATGKHRILKGGNFHCPLEELRISERHYKLPEDDSFYSGFRCVMDISYK